MPPKTYEASHEKDAEGGFTGHLMSDHDKQVNRALAGALFKDWLKGKPGKTLDIGSKYPFLAHCLKELGCDAYGMDNIDIVPDYARALEVPMLMADFEEISDAQIREWTKTDKFSLITLVHVFEHMYQPLETLRKLRKLITDDGTLFLRLPDHGVTGFEANLTPGHYTIHPFLYSFPALLELLVQTEDLFTVQLTYPINGAGQRDVMLKPIKKKPVLLAGMIVKNEERDLPRCLRSIESFIDGVVLVDTGSTDKTLKVAKKTIQKPVHTQIYTGASRQDDKGDWKIWNFSQARNVFVEEIEKRNADYLIWMDADDELITDPRNLRRVLYWGQYDVVGIMIESNGSRWLHQRMWKTGRGVRFEGRCHEYPAIGTLASLELSDSTIYHHAEPGIGESSNARNLRIMLEEFEATPSTRIAFYLANTYKDASRYKEAIPWYQKRLEMGVDFRDEWLFAWLNKARCERASKDFDAAKATLLMATCHAPDWCEFWMELAYMAHHDTKDYREAIAHALNAVDKPIPPTPLWREVNKYTDQPSRIISWSYEHLGDFDQAFRWALHARHKIAGPDRDWDKRIERLQGIVSANPAKTPSSPIEATMKPPPSLRFASQRGQDRFVWQRYFAHRSTPGVFVDIGASDGVEFSNTLAFERDLKWTGICVEPIPEVFARLARIRKRCVQAAVSDTTGKASFLRAENARVRTELMSGLVDKYDPRHKETVEKEIVDYGGTSTEIEVDTLTLNDLFEREGITHVDFLSMDTEGAEFDSLRILDTSMVTIDVMTIEVNFDDRLAPLQDMLRGKGFKFVARVGHDAIFEREGFEPEKPITANGPTSAFKDILNKTQRPITRPKIALYRQGAIGDILMTLNLIPLLQAEWREHDIVYFCHPSIGNSLRETMLAAGIHEIRDSITLDATEFASVFNLIGYPLHEGYPEKPMQQHLLHYFAHEMGLEPGILPSLRLPQPERPSNDLPLHYATLQTKTGWSIYKDWPRDRWAQVIAACPDIPIYQIGAAGEPRIEGARHDFMGEPLQSAIALVANASLHIGLDSFANHLTHYRWALPDRKVRRVPGVILWGSTQASASGYPTNTNISLGLSCQPCFREDPSISKVPRGVCINPPQQTYDDPKHACMFGIDVDRVVEAIKSKWGAW